MEYCSFFVCDSCLDGSCPKTIFSDVTCRSCIHHVGSVSLNLCSSCRLSGSPRCPYYEINLLKEKNYD